MTDTLNDILVLSEEEDTCLRWCFRSSHATFSKKAVIKDFLELQRKSLRCTPFQIKYQILILLFHQRRDLAHVFP